MSSSMRAAVVDDAGRKAVKLENGSIRAVIDMQGGMVPQFGRLRGPGLVNAHWVPGFRANDGKPWSEREHAGFWKARLLYDIAGDFPCAPNFGPPCSVDGVGHPLHGWTADREWRLEGQCVEGDRAWACFVMESPDPGLPLSFRKTDMVFEGQDALYSVLAISNPGPQAVSINVGRHTTLGPPFLQAGCRISLAAERFHAALAGTEFDPTGRLAQGEEFESLLRAPLRGGGSADISRVPGMIGFTDFVTGAIPKALALGWSCVVNPELRLAHVCFFPGAANLPAEEIALSFNDLWMQYGGRNFSPWSMGEGEPDTAFCLGTENATGAYANGLAYARDNPELLGRRTLVEIPAGGERRLCYGMALLPIDEELVREGVSRVEAEKDALVLMGRHHSSRFNVGAEFADARDLA